MIDFDRIYHGDCFELIRGIPDNSIDLVVTDPPYDIHTDPGKTVGNKIGKSLKGIDRVVAERSKIVDGYGIVELGNELVRVMKNINAYFWCSKKQIPDYMDFYVGRHKCKFDILFWGKTNPIPTYNKKYMTDVEYCLFFHKDAYLQPQSYEDASLFYIDQLNVKDKAELKHPTIKPLPMIERLVRNSSHKGEVVLDPFMGSGTTAVACIRNERRYVGFEIDDEYYSIASARIENETSTKKNSLF